MYEFRSWLSVGVVALPASFFNQLYVLYFNAMGDCLEHVIHSQCGVRRADERLHLDAGLVRRSLDNAIYLYFAQFNV